MWWGHREAAVPPGLPAGLRPCRSEILTQIYICLYNMAQTGVWAVLGE